MIPATSSVYKTTTSSPTVQKERQKPLSPSQNYSEEIQLFMCIWLDFRRDSMVAALAGTGR